MKRKLQKITNIITPVYLSLLTCFAILREVVPLSKYVGNDLFAYSFFGGGLLIILLSFTADKKFIRVPHIAILAMFIGICAVSTLINGFAFLNNIKTIGWLIIFFFLVYVSGSKSDKIGEKNINAVFITAVTTMGILCFASFLMYIFDVDYVYFSEHFVKEFTQGFSHQYMRLWGVFLENNYAAIYGLVTIFMGAYLFKKYSNVFARIGIILSALFAFCFMTLTNSRTCQVVCAVSVMWVVFYVFACKFQNKKIFSVLVPILTSVIAAILTFALFFCTKYTLPYVKIGIRELVGEKAYYFVHKSYDDLYRFGEIKIFSGYLPEKNEEQEQNKVDSEDSNVKKPETQKPETQVPESQNPAASQDAITKPETLDRTDLDKKDFSNGRFRRWKEGLDIFLKTPIFGASPRGVRDFAKIHFPDSYVALYNYSISNFVIDLLASTGILGLAIVLWLFLKIFMLVIRLTFKRSFSNKVLFVAGIALTLIVASLFQADLFFNMAFGGVAFWMAMGILSSYKFKVTAENDEERVLVYGLKDPVGGVEHVALEYVRAISKNHSLKFDFLYFGSCSIENELTQLGARVLYMPSRKRNPIAYKKAIKRVFEENNYIAVWGNYSGLTNIDLLTYAYDYDIPVRIAHSHVSNLSWNGFLMKCFVNVFHRINKFFVDDYVTHYFACSEKAGHFMFPKKSYKKLIVCKNAVDTMRFCDGESDVREKLGISDDAFVIAHVARMCKEKNQSFLIDVFEKVVQKNPDSVLLMVGDGEKKADLEYKANQLRLSEKIKFLGECFDVPEILRASDVFVLTSYTEGFGLVVIEAQACGVPCVVSDTVPKDVAISDAVRFVSLSDSAEDWADAVISSKTLSVGNATECVIKNGFEIFSESEKIYKIFKGEK